MCASQHRWQLKLPWKVQRLTLGIRWFKFIHSFSICLHKHIIFSRDIVISFTTKPAGNLNLIKVSGNYSAKLLPTCRSADEHQQLRRRMLFTGEKNPDTALRIKEVEQNIWRHTISSSAALAASSLQPNLLCVLVSAESERLNRSFKWKLNGVISFLTALDKSDLPYFTVSNTFLSI